jgi:tRNA-Thr(GGU) m(6)t(6)A37 methyltransferase TsaA
LSICFNPIGFVRTKLSDEEVRNKPHDELEADIEILSEYVEGLEAIDGFSHLLVFFYLNKVTAEQRKLLKTKPRSVVRYGLTVEELPLVGVFSLDAPHRPNPIGLTAVKLVWRKDRILRVKGLDALNETPVLDLKPYSPARKIDKFEVPDWYKNVISKVKAKGHDIIDF